MIHFHFRNFFEETFKVDDASPKVVWYKFQGCGHLVKQSNPILVTPFNNVFKNCKSFHKIPLNFSQLFVFVCRLVFWPFWPWPMPSPKRFGPQECPPQPAPTTPTVTTASTPPSGLPVTPLPLTYPLSNFPLVFQLLLALTSPSVPKGKS